MLAGARLVLDRRAGGAAGQVGRRVLLVLQVDVPAVQGDPVADVLEVADAPVALRLLAAGQEEHLGALGVRPVDEPVHAEHRVHVGVCQVLVLALLGVVEAHLELVVVGEQGGVVHVEDDGRLGLLARPVVPCEGLGQVGAGLGLDAADLPCVVAVRGGVVLAVRRHRVAVVRLDLVLYLREVGDLLVGARHGVFGGGLADAEDRGAGDEGGDRGGAEAGPSGEGGAETGGAGHARLLRETSVTP